MVAAPLTRWERLRLLDRKCQKLKDAMGLARYGSIFVPFKRNA